MMAPGLIGATLKKLGRGRLRPREDSEVTTSPNTGVLPIIICELIIDSVAGHRHEVGPIWAGKPGTTLETLRACSLTCRAWTPRSQYHLFHYLTVRCSQRWVTRAVALLTKNPALGPRIAVLVLRPATRTLDSIPRVLPETLPRVPELRISQAVVTLKPNSNIETSLRAFPALTTLTLFSCVFQSANDLRRIISALYDLQTLVIDRPEWGREKTVPPLSVLPTISRLKSLFLSASAAWLGDARGSWFLQWLALSGAVRYLVKLMLMHAMIFDSGVLTMVRGIMAASAGTLEELNWSASSQLVYTSLCPVIARCKKLKTIALGVLYRSPAFEHLISFLGDLQVTATVMVLRFLDIPDNSNPPSDTQWRSLDQMLQDPRLASVAGLLVYREMLAASQSAVGEFQFDEATGFAAMREQIVQNMPLSHRRKIVYSRITGPYGNQVVRL